MDGHAVLGDDGDINGSGAVVHLDAHALADVLGSAEGFADGAHHAGATAAEGGDAGNLAGSDAGDLGHNDIIDAGGAEIGLQVLVALRGRGRGGVVSRGGLLGDVLGGGVLSHGGSLSLCS